jgi:hypothetical protein
MPILARGRIGGTGIPSSVFAPTAVRLVSSGRLRAGLPEEEGQERNAEHHHRHNRRHGVIRPVRGRPCGLTFVVLLHEPRTRGVADRSPELP